MIPDNIHSEFSKWVQSYPENELPIRISNVMFECGKEKELKRLAKKYNMNLESVLNFYKS